MNKPKIPIGMVVLCVLIALSSLFQIKNGLSYEAKLIIFGQLLSNAISRAYFIVSGALGLAVVAGLLYKKLWALWLFVAFNIFNIATSLVTYFLVNNSILLKAGWQPRENLLKAYQNLMLFGVIMAALFTLWALKYRKILKK